MLVRIGLDEIVLERASRTFVQRLVLKFEGLLNLLFLGDPHLDEDLPQAGDGHLAPLGRLGLDPEGLVDFIRGGDALLQEDLAEEKVFLANLGIVGAFGEDLPLLLEKSEKLLVLHEAAAHQYDAQGALLACFLERGLFGQALLELKRRNDALLERQLSDEAVGGIRHSLIPSSRKP